MSLEDYLVTAEDTKQGSQQKWPEPKHKRSYGWLVWLVIIAAFIGSQIWHNAEEQGKETNTQRKADRQSHLELVTLSKVNLALRNLKLISNFDCEQEINIFLDEPTESAHYNCFIVSKLSKLTPDDFVAFAKPLENSNPGNGSGLSNYKISFQPIEQKYEITYLFRDGKFQRRTIKTLDTSNNPLEVESDREI